MILFISAETAEGTVILPKAWYSLDGAFLFLRIVHILGFGQDSDITNMHHQITQFLQASHLKSIAVYLYRATPSTGIIFLVDTVLNFDSSESCLNFVTTICDDCRHSIPFFI